MGAGAKFHFMFFVTLTTTFGDGFLFFVLRRIQNLSPRCARKVKHIFFSFHLPSFFYSISCHSFHFIFIYFFFPFILLVFPSILLQVLSFSVYFLSSDYISFYFCFISLHFLFILHSFCYHVRFLLAFPI